MKRLKILRSAKLDLADGFDFYERQERGVGGYFIQSLKEQIERLKQTAGIHRKEYRHFHRMFCHPFPYAVYYLMNEDVATVCAVVDCRRDLVWIREHLDAVDDSFMT